MSKKRTYVSWYKYTYRGMKRIFNSQLYDVGLYIIYEDYYANGMLKNRRQGAKTTPPTSAFTKKQIAQLEDMESKDLIQDLLYSTNTVELNEEGIWKKYTEPLEPPEDYTEDVSVSLTSGMKTWKGKRAFKLYGLQFYLTSDNTGNLSVVESSSGGLVAIGCRALTVGKTEKELCKLSKQKLKEAGKEKVIELIKRLNENRDS